MASAANSNDHSTPILPGPRQQQQHHNGTSATTRRPSRPSAEHLSHRRSSTLSLDSFKDDMWLPRPKLKRSRSDDSTAEDASFWASLPLAFALLPAIGGMLFTNGSAVISDILLLGLAAIFLNWSVRLPWTWYRSAQELRTQDAGTHSTFSDGDISDGDSSPEEPHTCPDGSPNFNVPTAEDIKVGAPKESTTAPRSARKLRQITTYEASRRSLYRHELLALLCCFTFPVAGAYLLHTLRDSLSRPSEGLVSNFNLTIFLLAAELRPMSHLVKLVQARTLHLQRVVKDNPYQSVDEQQNEDISHIRERIEELEARIPAAPLQTQSGGPSSISKGVPIDEKDMSVVSAGVRKHLQPELDALNRAVRRYEKRAALQAMQTESRLLDLEARLGDAISLAAAATRSSHSKGTVATIIEWIGAAVLLPWQVVGSVMQVPFGIIKRILGVMGFGSRKVNPGRDTRVQVDVGRRKSGSRGGREAERVLKAQTSTVR